MVCPGESYSYLVIHHFNVRTYQNVVDKAVQIKGMLIFHKSVRPCYFMIWLLWYLRLFSVSFIVKGALLQPCSDIPWNETFLDKVYYILHSEDPATYSYSNVAETCNGISMQKLVVDSLAENDFIAEMMKKYQPGMESKAFLACPSDNALSISFRKFDCRESEAIYEEETHWSQGFWSKRLNIYLSLFHSFCFFIFRDKKCQR